MKRLDKWLLEKFTNSVLLDIRAEMEIPVILRSTRERLIQGMIHEWSKVDASDAVEIARERMNELVERLAREGFAVARTRAELVSKGLVGTNNPSAFKIIFDVGLYIDESTGLPYYPASSIRSVVRRAFEREYIANEELKGEFEVVEEIVFGKGEADEGLVAFFDALPIGCSPRVRQCAIFTGAAVTPHYYKDGVRGATKVVKNELSVTPSPRIFVAIAPGLIYDFVLAVSEEELVKVMSTNKSFSKFVKKYISDDPTLAADKLVKSLSSMLVRELEIGAFARSSKGYNVFKPFYGALRERNIKVFTAYS